AALRRRRSQCRIAQLSPSGGRNRMSFLKPRRRLFLAVALVALVWLASGGAQAVQGVARESYDNLEVFTNILAIVQKNYVDSVSTKQLIEGAINGMLTSLDPHSAYLTPDLY